jgi:hypothetical protein
MAMLLLPIRDLSAQTPVAPLPSQILTAKKVFISNAGGYFSSDFWSGTADRTYNEFYEAVKGWGRYELVSSPGDSDLVLEITLDNPPPSFKLVLLDPKTHTTLWRLYRGMDTIGLKNTRDKKFSETIGGLVGDLKALTARPEAAAK